MPTTGFPLAHEEDTGCVNSLILIGSKVEINLKLLSSFLHTNKEPHVDFLRNTCCFPVARTEGQGPQGCPQSVKDLISLKGGLLGCARTDCPSAPNHTTRGRPSFGVLSNTSVETDR
jgi:hypothetical protein